jgi:hypothetical protein
LDGAKTWNLRRTGALAVVLVVHIALIAVVVFSFRAPHASSPVQDFISTWIVLRTVAVARPPSGPWHLQQTPSSPISPIQIELPKVDPVPIPSEDSSAIVDWAEEAHTEGANLHDVPRTREFGVFPRAQFDGPTLSGPIHRAGESSRDAEGNKTVWVTDGCYIVSEAPPPGTPDVLARRQPTHTVCVDRSAPEGELFSDSSAYKKYRAP